jgi:hypothetical protein
VYAVYLTCDNQLAVYYRHGQRIISRPPGGEETAPGQWLGVGGSPAVCCLYPTVQGERAEQLFDLALVWSYAGEWVHRFLYKKLPYTIITPPVPCGPNCICGCSVTTSVVGQTVTITVTVTNTDGSSLYGDAPEGDVQILVDGAQIADITLPENEPDNTSAVTVQTTYSCTDGNAHTVTANYNPASGSGFIACSCGASFQCPPCTTVGCCPSCIPNTLKATNQNTGEQATLTYNSGVSRWEGSTTMVCGHTITIRVACPTGSTHVTDWRFQGSWDGTTFSNCGADVSSTCSPLALQWFACRIGGTLPPGCSANQDWTVTP